MKKILIIMALLVGFQAAQAQSGKVKERDLRGVWKMKISMGEDFLEDEIDDEENAFVRMVLRASGSLVEGILENIDIELEFLDDHRCRVYIDAFGHEEVEYSEWRINRYGELYIEDTDSFHMSDDEYWIFEDDVLVAYDNGDPIDDEVSVYLVRID